MVDLAAFPDVEVAVMDLIEDLATVGTTTPADLIQQLPFVRVLRFGGSDDRFTDSPRIDIDVFESTRPLAFTLAETIRARLLSFPHVINGVVIDKATTLVGPQEVPWSDPNVRHLTASYTVALRR